MMPCNGLLHATLTSTAAPRVTCREYTLPHVRAGLDSTSSISSMIAEVRAKATLQQALPCAGAESGVAGGACLPGGGGIILLDSAVARGAGETCDSSLGTSAAMRSSRASVAATAGPFCASIEGTEACSQVCSPSLSPFWRVFSPQAKTTSSSLRLDTSGSYQSLLIPALQGRSSSRSYVQDHRSLESIFLGLCRRLLWYQLANPIYFHHTMMNTLIVYKNHTFKSLAGSLQVLTRGSGPALTCLYSLRTARLHSDQY